MSVDVCVAVCTCIHTLQQSKVQDWTVMDWVPQASGVFIFRVQPVAQVIPGIKGYAWITAVSLPLVQGLNPPPPPQTHPHPHPHPLFLWMKTDRKLCFPLRQLLHSPLSDGRCPPVLSARGKIYLCHFNSDLLLMLWWWFHIKFSSETDHYLVAANLDPVGMFLFKACSNTRLLNLTFTAMKTQCWALTVCTILKIKRPFCI